MIGHILSLAVSWHFWHETVIRFGGPWQLPRITYNSTINNCHRALHNEIRMDVIGLLHGLTNTKLTPYDVQGHGLWEQAIWILDEVCCKEAGSASMISMSRKTSKTAAKFIMLRSMYITHFAIAKIWQALRIVDAYCILWNWYEFGFYRHQLPQMLQGSLSRFVIHLQDSMSNPPLQKLLRRF